MKRLTAEILYVRDACPNGVAEFIECFPDGCDVTPENLRKAYKHLLNIIWLFRVFPKMFKDDADEMRKVAIEHGHGYDFAQIIDKGSRDDTRAAAIEEGEAYIYARYVDMEPRQDTYEGSRSLYGSQQYEEWADTFFPGHGLVFEYETELIPK